MDARVAKIVAQTPILSEARVLTARPLGGLTNTNYLVTADGDEFVVRVSGGNSDLLDIDRASELETLTAAAAAGIGPEVVRFFLPEGHLVTRLIEGRHLSRQEYRAPWTLRRVVEAVKQIHDLPPVKATFSPFRRVESYARKVVSLGVSLPEDFDVFMARVRRVEADRRGDPYPWLRFCHNDLFAVNFLDDGGIRIVDWEFAGMGDIYFDFATLAYAYDSDGPLPSDDQQYLLECYFGEVTAVHQRRLDGMKFALLFFTVERLRDVGVERALLGHGEEIGVRR